MAELIFKVARTSRFWERAMHGGRMPPRASAACGGSNVSPRTDSLAGLAASVFRAGDLLIWDNCLTQRFRER